MTQRFVAFEFRGINFKTRPGQMVYLYRLAGYEEEWRQTREGRVRVQTHLRLSLMTKELAARNQELVREIAQRKKLKGRLSMISQREAERWGLEAFVGENPTVRKIFADIRLLQESAGISVLIAERALMESGGGEIRPEHLHFQPEAGAAPYREMVDVAQEEVPLDLEKAELWLIKRAIDRTGGNISEAARLLGTNRTRIYRVLSQEEKE